MGKREVGFFRHLPIAYAPNRAVRNYVQTALALRLWVMLFLRRLLLSRAVVRFAWHRKSSNATMRNAAIRRAARAREPPLPVVDFFWQYHFACGLFLVK